MLDNELIVVCRIDPDTRKPSYEFKGRWTGRWLKMAMAKMPRSYRKHMAEILKEENKKEKNGVSKDYTVFAEILGEKGMPAVTAL